MSVKKGHWLSWDAGNSAADWIQYWITATRPPQPPDTLLPHEKYANGFRLYKLIKRNGDENYNSIVGRGEKKRFMCSVAMTTTTGDQDNAKAYRTADRKQRKKSVYNLTPLKYTQTHLNKSWTIRCDDGSSYNSKKEVRTWFEKVGRVFCG